MLKKRLGSTRLAARWFMGALVVTMLPKCILCAAAYVAAAIGIGRVGVELCGEVAGGTTSHVAWLGGSVALTALLVAWMLGNFLRRRRVGCPDLRRSFVE